MKYFFDTYAIIEIIKKNEKFAPYEKEEITTSVLNIGELYYALLRDFDEKTADMWIEKLRPVSVSIDIDTVVEAMKFKSKNKDKGLSFVDVCSYAIAEKLGLVLLTGDKGFLGLSGAEVVQ